MRLHMSSLHYVRETRVERMYLSAWVPAADKPYSLVLLYGKHCLKACEFYIQDATYYF